MARNKLKPRTRKIDGAMQYPPGSHPPGYKRRRYIQVSSERRVKIPKIPQDAARTRSTLHVVYPELSDEGKHVVMARIESFMKNKVTDRTLLWEKAKLTNKYPHYTSDLINSTLLLNASRNEKFAGKDLKVFSLLQDPGMIQSTEVSKYLSIGMDNIGAYLNKGGIYHFIICGSPNLLRNQILVDQLMTTNIPVIYMPGFSLTVLKMTDVQNGPVIGFKKVQDNPFHELVKVIAEKVPNSFAPWITGWKENVDQFKGGDSNSGVASKDGTDATSKMEQISNVDVVEDTQNLNGEKTEVCNVEVDHKDLDCKEMHDSDKATDRDVQDSCININKNVQDRQDINSDQKQVSDTDLCQKTLFTHTCPRIAEEHHKIILDEVKTVLESKLTGQWLTWRKDKMLSSASLTEDSVHDLLYEIIVHKEKYAGTDIIGSVLSLSDESMITTIAGRYKYIITGFKEISKYINMGGQLHFFVYDNKTAELLNKNEEFTSLVKHTPGFTIDGLVNVISKFFLLGKERVIGFKKVESNPFHELVKFVADKIPDEHSPWIKPWKESIDEFEAIVLDNLSNSNEEKSETIDNLGGNVDRLSNTDNRDNKETVDGESNIHLEEY